MNTVRISLLLLLVFAGLNGSWAADELPHVAVVVGTHHYSAHRSLPLVAKELERLGFQVTLVMGEGDPEKKTQNVLPGIEVLGDVDVMILYARFLNLPDNELKHFNEYVESGKPIVALRTSNHAFRFPKFHEFFSWNTEFGRRAIGTPYVAHQSTRTNVSIVKRHETHPILRGVGNSQWESPAKLYLTRLEPGCVPLLIGEGEGKAKLLEKNFGTVHINESETDIVAWTWKNEWGGKVFSTTLGHAGDFAEESFIRMLLNSIYWATDRDIPTFPSGVKTWDIEMEFPSRYQSRKDESTKKFDGQ